jgi:hypothetical protein
MLVAPKEILVWAAMFPIWSNVLNILSTISYVLICQAGLLQAPPSHPGDGYALR